MDPQTYLRDQIRRYDIIRNYKPDDDYGLFGRRERWSTPFKAVADLFSYDSQGERKYNSNRFRFQPPLDLPDVRESVRPRTGNPVVDGLTGVEPNPGPNKKNGAKKIIQAEKKMVKALKRVGKPKKRNPRKRRDLTTVSAPTAIGTATRNNYHSIGAVDNCIVDCVRAGAVNVRGTCFSNIGVGTSTVAGDRNGLYLDGTLSPQLFLAFNFQDFDDRVYALATTYQFYRFRELTAEYVPLVGTSQVGQWALSISDNFQPTGGSEPSTIRSLLTSSISAAGTPWVPNSLPKYVYNGAKVWSCPSTDEDGSNASLYEQFAYIGRFLNTIASGAEVETGRFQFHYSVDFFEPRGNRGSITASNITLADVHSFLGNTIMAQMRLNRTSWRLPFVKALRSLANDLCAKYDLVEKQGKDEESDCEHVIMEQNPLTQSIHIPRTIVQQLTESLRR